MKTKIFLFLAIIVVGLLSCEFSGSNNSTLVLGYVALVNKTDTLDSFYTGEANVLSMDTIVVGDTVLFKLFLNGGYNNLTVLSVKQSDTIAAKLLFPTMSSMDSIISTSTSNISKGYFNFLGEQNFVFFPVKYVSKGPSSTASIEFYLSSDAKFENSIGYNSTSFKLITPIKAKQDTIE